MAECAAPAVTCSIARCELWQSDNEVGLQMQHFDGRKGLMKVLTMSFVVLKGKLMATMCSAEFSRDE